MSGTGSRSRVVTRTARASDLAAVLALVRQHRADAHAEDVLTGSTRLNAAASGFRRLLEDPGHRVVLAVLPGSPAPADGDRGEVAVGLAVLGLDPLSLVLGNPQVTIDTFVVHREHRRCGTGARLLAAAADYAGEIGAAHVVAAVGWARGGAAAVLRAHGLRAAQHPTDRLRRIAGPVADRLAAQRPGGACPPQGRDDAPPARTADGEVRRRRVSAVIRRR